MTYIQTRAEQMDTETLQRGSLALHGNDYWGFIGWKGCPRSALIHSGLPRSSGLQPRVTLATSSCLSLCCHGRHMDTAKPARRNSGANVKPQKWGSDVSEPAHSKWYSQLQWSHMLGKYLEIYTKGLWRQMQYVWVACLKGRNCNQGLTL